MIDAHHHLWDPRAREYDWLGGGQPWASDEDLAKLRHPFTLADLRPLATDAGVTGTVAVQTVDDEWETRDLLALAAGIDLDGNAIGSSHANPLLAGVVGWVDLTSPDVEGAVARLRAQPGGSFLRGIRHPLLSEPDPAWLTRPDVLRGLRGLGNTGLCFDVIALPHQLESAVAAARSVPEVSYVLNHLGGPPVGTGERPGDSTWASTIRSLGELSNVTCKLSGIHGPSVRASALRPYYATVLEAFGPDRLMFGSDWPVSSLAAAYGEVCALYRELTADLTAADQAAVFDRTARRVYGLGEAST